MPLSTWPCPCHIILLGPQWGGNVQGAGPSGVLGRGWGATPKEATCCRLVSWSYLYPPWVNKKVPDCVDTRG